MANMLKNVKNVKTDLTNAAVHNSRRLADQPDSVLL